MPRTLLLADDSVTIQRVIELTFAHEDVRVVLGRRRPARASSGWRANGRTSCSSMSRCRKWTATPSPSTSRRRPRLKNVPVLLLAGAFEPVDEHRARSIGCDGVLVKPFEPQHLVTRVKDLLNQAATAGHNHVAPAVRHAGGRGGISRLEAVSGARASARDAGHRERAERRRATPDQRRIRMRRHPNRSNPPRVRSGNRRQSPRRRFRSPPGRPPPTARRRKSRSSTRSPRCSLPNNRTSPRRPDRSRRRCQTPPSKTRFAASSRA